MKLYNGSRRVLLTLAQTATPIAKHSERTRRLDPVFQTVGPGEGRLMKVLGLLRHAKSDWDDMALRDFDRGLNDRGRRGAALIGRHIDRYGIKWDAILASPAQRVKRTLEASGLDAPIRWHSAAYLADGDTLIGLLHELEDNLGSVLLVGHNPGLQDLILDLIAPNGSDRLYDEIAAKYPTASFAMLQLDIENWKDCAPDCGRLIHFARPRDLDPELGPEQVG